MSQRIWTELGIEGLRLEINSLGTAGERQVYRGALKSYFSLHLAALDEDSLNRLERNPLRILDSKAASMQQVIAGAPSFHDFLGEESRAHFERLRRYLDTLGFGTKSIRAWFVAWIITAILFSNG
jgi:histidyl-tRNA synthetase